MNIFLKAVILSFTFLSSQSLDSQQKIELIEITASLRIDTIFGTEIIDHPLILELLATPMMQRLHKIDQSGMPHYIGKIGPYTRFEHSFRVYQLVKRFGAPLEEQVAALLHDASHTVFSHTGDWLFNAVGGDAYQDAIHHWFLSKQEIEPILNKHGITLEQALAEENNYLRLEQELPDLCSDRLEYNLYTGYIEGLLTSTEILEILEDINYENGKWFFEDPVLAAKFASLSLHFTEHLWACPWNVAVNELSAKALNRSLMLGLITLDDFHFSTDQVVLNILNSSDDSYIRELVSACQNIENSFTECHPNESEYSCYCKFRGINPLLKINQEFVRLTEIDGNFAEAFRRVKSLVAKGIHLKFVVKNAIN